MTDYRAERLNKLYALIDGAGANGVTRKQLREAINLTSDRGILPYIDQLLDSGYVVAVKSWDRSNGRTKWFYYRPDFVPEKVA